jgi:outer membrane protein OmpA-like peptidoglycan-associated protein
VPAGVKRVLAALALIAAATASCSSGSSLNATVERARSDVVAAASDPLVRQHARPELESAQDAFAQAERGWRTGGDSKTVSHWAEVAGQRAATAQAAARTREAEEQSQRAEQEQQQKLAEARRIESEPAGTDVSASSGAADSPVRRGTGAVFVFSNDQFQQDGAALDARAEAGIERIAALLREDPQRIVRLESHADDIGNRNRSIELSGRRAEAVRAALVARGIEPRRIVVRALGDSYPVASNETALGRERNRRVEAVLGTAARSGGP